MSHDKERDFDDQSTVDSPRVGTGHLTERIFSEGEILAGRFRIVAFLARGGMGEVYEAEDLELQERVALKTIRRDAGLDDTAIQRFRREIQLARKVTHPNVCRIFDVFHHSSKGAVVTFLSMELLSGKTLLQQILESGPMKTDQALPIVQQMADALTAAHKVGVIHRDFKSANVLLVPQNEDGMRAVVTDFGLARSVTQSDSSSLSQTGNVVGTPSYMAPEQVLGKEITAATDIYAFGLVVFEMVTGKLPFTGDTPISIATNRLHNPPPSPRTYSPDLDQKWESAILRCLKIAPEKRFAQAADFLLEVQRQHKTKRVAAMIGVAILLLLASLFGWIQINKLGRQQPTSDVAETLPDLRKAIAVLSFRNLSGRAESNWLSAALSETIRSELAAGEKLRVVPGEDVIRMKQDLNLPDTDTLAKDTLEKIEKRLATTLVVTGSYLAFPNGTIRVDLRVQDTDQGRILASVKEEGSEKQLLNLISQVGSDLRSSLGVGDLTPAQQQAMKASLPSDVEAIKLYTEGLEKLRQFEYPQAIELLKAAVQKQPDFALAHSALSEAWSGSGFDKEALEEAKIASQSSAKLPKEERLVIEARSFFLMNKHEKAAEIYQALHTFYPDDIEYSVALADSHIRGFHYQNALNVVETIRKTAEPMANDPRVYMVQGRALQYLVNWDAAKKSFLQAITEADKRGAKLLKAEAKLLLGWAYFELDFAGKESEKTFLEARQMFKEAGDARHEADTLFALARIYRARFEDLDKVLAMMKAALAVQDRIGNQRGRGDTLRRIASTYRFQGELQLAASTTEEVLQIWRSLGDKLNEGGGYYVKGQILYGLGDLKSSCSALRQAIALFRETRERGDEGGTQGQLSSILKEKGELQEAKKNLREAMAIFSELDVASYQQFLGIGSIVLGEILAMEGDLAGAESEMKKAEEFIKKGYKTPSVLVSSDFLRLKSMLLLEKGNTTEAMETAAKVAREFERKDAPDYKILALEIYARTLLAAGRIEEAHKVIQQARKQIKPFQEIGVKFRLGITEARILSAAGKKKEAEASLWAILNDASKKEFVPLAFEAQLALAEVKKEQGDAESCRELLQSLQKQARSKGFLLIARKADQMMKI